MKKILLIMLALCVIVFAKTITGESSYTFGESESIIQAKKTCKQLAIKNAVESFATYIESESVIRDFVTEKDVIVARSLALVRDVEVLEEKMDLANMSIFYKIKGEINEQEVIDALKQKSADGTIDEIKRSGLYYFGEADNANAREADKKAVENFIVNLADNLQSSYSDIVPPGEDVYEFTETVLNTFKSAFSGCEKKAEGTKVLRYIKKDDIGKLFEQRLKKLNDYVDFGIKAEKEVRIGDALKYYYWALALLRSHPDHNKLTSGKFDNKLLIISLNDKIDKIFSDLSFNVFEVAEEGSSKLVSMKVLYKEVEVQNIDFAYHFGNDWSVLNSVRNGLAVCELDAKTSKNLNSLKINVEYRYEEKSRADHELSTVIEDISQKYFPASVMIVQLNQKYEKPEKSKVPKLKLSDFAGNSSSENAKDPEIIPEKTREACTDIVVKIVKAITSKEYASVKPYFTDSGYDVFTKLISYGNARLITDKIELKTGQINDEIVVRSLPLQLKFPNNNRVTTENAVFTFSKDTKVCNVSFALSDIAVKDIMSKPDSFGSIHDKLQIMQFMENYKTAYCLEDLDYIKEVFAENALIIVGKVLKRSEKPIGEMYDRLGSDKVKYVKMSKKAYMESLELVFRSNEFVNIQFEDNIISKMGRKGKIYGIQIKQNYFSSNYADEGYLFLMMDLTDPKEPTIYVRSWQPERNPDGSIIGLEDFE